jgi:hypothetical protein
MRDALPALLVVGAVALLAVAYDRAQEIRWSGGYPVQVRIERSSPRPTSSLSAAVLFRREWDLTEGDPSRIDSGWQAVPASGEPFTVNVKCGGRDSGLGRPISYVRQELLVLRVAYADGGGELVVAELPDSRSTRERVVRVP